MKLIQATHQCFKCNKGTLDSRTKRGFFVKNVLFFLPIKRYRCNFCDSKTYVLESN